MKHVYPLLLVLFVSSSSASAAEKPVPKFEGKPVAYWLERFEKAETEKERIEAADAIRAFGADVAPVLPRLIEMLDDRSSSYRAMIGNVLKEIGPGAKAAAPTLIRMLKDKTAQDPNLIIEVLASMKPDAKDFLPVLITSLDNPDTANAAIAALRGLGPAAKEAVPALIKAVENPKLERMAVLNFYYSEPDETRPDELAAPRSYYRVSTGAPNQCRAAAVLGRMGPAAKQATSALRKQLNAKDSLLRICVAEALWKIEKDASVIPVLIAFVEKDESFGARRAALSLGEIGPEAKAALPALKKALATNDVDLKQIVQDAIKKIGAEPQEKE